MSEYFVRGDGCRTLDLFAGVRARTMAGQQVMISLVEFDPGAEVPEHEHPHEQLGMLLEGELEFTVGGETQRLRAGDLWRIPGGVSHQVRAGATPVKAIDIFHPVREEYL